MSRDISGSGSKPAIEFVCSLILVLQNVQFEFRQGLRHYNGLYDPTTRRRQERRLKSDFAFFQSLKRLFLPTCFVNYRRTLLKLNFKGPN